MFDLLQQNQLPRHIPTKLPPQSAFETEETEEIFVDIYSGEKKTTEKKKKARGLYQKQSLLPIAYQLLYVLPKNQRLQQEQETQNQRNIFLNTINPLYVNKQKRAESEERLSQRKFVRAFNMLYDKIDEVANYLKKEGHFLFGDPATYAIGKAFLSDVSKTTENHLKYVTDNKLANLSEQSFTKYVQLSFLQESPESFLKSQQNLLLRKETEKVSLIKKTLFSLSTKTEKIALKEFGKLSADIQGINTNIDEKSLNTQINTLQNSWVRKLFGWLTGDNKKLNDLKQLQSGAKLIKEQTIFLSTAIDKQCEIELAKGEFIDIQKKLLAEPHKLDKEAITQWQKSLAILFADKKLTSSLIQPSLTQLANKLKENIQASFDVNDNEFNRLLKPALQHQFTAMFSPKNEEASLFEEDMIRFNTTLLENIQDPYIGLSFCKRLKECLQDQPDLLLTKMIERKQEQFAAWVTLRKATTINGKIYYDANETYTALVTLLSTPMTTTMSRDVNDFFSELSTILQNDLDVFMKKAMQKYIPADDNDIVTFKEQLALFSKEKLDCLNQAQTRQFAMLRDTFLNIIINNVNACTTSNELQNITHVIETIWPDGILARYVTLHNTSSQPFTWLPTERADTLPDTIECNRSLLALYKPSIANLTLNPRQETQIYVIPRFESTELKNAILQKRNTFLARHVKQADKEKFAFLRENKGSILYECWKAWFLNNETPLDAYHLFSYGSHFVDNSLEKLFTTIDELYRDNQNNEATWLSEELSTEIESIARAFDQKLDALFSQRELKKFDQTMKITNDPIDLSHLLLQWHFLSLLHNSYYIDSQASRMMAADIMRKMRDIVAEEPKFILNFLGSMNQRQLDVLESTFKHDYIWELKKPDNNSIKQSTLLHQVSELVKQELQNYLNGMPVNEKLMHKHADFVYKRLNADKHAVAYEAMRQFNHELKDELLSAFTWLLKNQEDNAELILLINQLQKTDNVVAFVKELSQEIISQFPEELAAYLNKIQYYRANRFKNSLGSLLDEFNLLEPESLKRVQQLKGSSVQKLAQLTINDEDQVCHIFKIYNHAVPKTNWSLQPYLKACYTFPVKCMQTIYNSACYLTQFGQQTSSKQETSRNTLPSLTTKALL